jgi:translation initiation factor 2 alpha subunit (eIF-2alpha)
MTVKEDDLVLCTVKSIDGTTIFLEIEGNGQASLAFSEVSPGRIRNIREFINIGKKVVCKVLRIRGDHIELSLRRVTTKEREKVLDRYTKERTLLAILKPILGEKTPQIIEKISSQYELADFLDSARENPKLIEPFVSKTEAANLEKIFTEKREKEKEIKRTVTIKSTSESGINDIQQVLTTAKADVRYLGSSKFSVIVKEKEFKQANTKIAQILKEMEEKARALKVQFEVKE